MLYSPDMSRRARGIELWAALKSLGRSGVEALITHLCDRAQQFATDLAAVGYTVVNDVNFNQVAVRLCSDAKTQAVLKAIQNSGECWVGGLPVFRRSDGSWFIAGRCHRVHLSLRL